jgi:2-phosphosulfolactate phosphatase
VRVHVAFTPAETVSAPTGIVVDVLRATSTIVQALAAGYRRVLSCSEVDEATALRDTDGGGVLAGERKCVRIPGFDLGNSPREFLEPRGETLILTTTNGTRALVTATLACERVLAASLLNLEAVVAAARAEGDDVAIFCAGVKGEFALDDAYVAGRLVELLDGE